MDTPLGLRRHLLLTFPEVQAATVSFERGHTLRVCYVPSEAGLPDHELLWKWLEANRTAGVGATLERVDALITQEMPEALLSGGTMPLDVAEDAAINMNGMIEHMRRRWPEQFVRFDPGLGVMNLVVTQGTSDEVTALMAREMSLLLHGVRVNVSVDTTHRVRPHVRSAAELRLLEDWDEMHSSSHKAACGEYVPPQRAPGVFAFLPLKTTPLFCHLALAERVYVEMPRTTAEVSKRYGVEWVDLVETMSTNRIVPVFRQTSDRYEHGMLESALDAGTCVLPGASRLNELAAFAAENPSFALASRLDERWRMLHALVRAHPHAQVFRPIFDAIAASAAGARYVARQREVISKAWAPYVFAVEKAFRPVENRRELEVLSAVDVSLAAQGCGVRPIVPDGDLIGQYVRWLHSVRPKAATAQEPTFVEEPPVVASVIMSRIDGISLAQFARSFDGAAIHAMHNLVQSPQLVGQPVADVVAAWGRELHAFNGKRRRAAALGGGAVSVALTVADLSVGWGLFSIVAGYVSSLLIEKSVVPDEQLAKMLRTTKEAAYLARINAAIQNA
jgi:hypothetical protein